MKLMTRKTLLGLSFVAAVACGVAGCDRHASTASAPQPGSVTQVADADVSSKVKMALASDDVLKSFDITVETLKGDVKLKGEVNDQTQIDRAREIARRVEGVRAIHDELTVKQ